MRRHAIILSLLAYLVTPSALCAFSAEDASTPAADDPFSSIVRPILAARCFGCHAGKNPEAGLDLTLFKTRDEVLGAFRLWEKVIAKVETRAMPPEEAKPLSDLQRRTLSDWHQRTFVALEPRPGPGRARRLTRTEYRNTLADLLGIALRKNPLESFYNVEAGSIVEKLLPVDPPGPSGFDNDASVLAFGPAELAKVAPGRRLSRRSARLASRGPSGPLRRRAQRGGGNARASGRVRFSRSSPAGPSAAPVAESELTPFLAVFEAAFAPPGRARPPRTRIPASPRPSRSHSRPSSSRRSSSTGSRRPAVAHEPYRISDHELATRLSYFLWSTMPDDALRTLAAEGRLHEEGVLDRQVDRMLADPRSIALSENFGGQWLGYAELDSPDRFQASRSEEATKLMRSIYREPLLFFDDLMRLGPQPARSDRRAVHVPEPDAGLPLSPEGISKAAADQGRRI